jgi:dipeptidyl aminopeptidase/acylaminoacyl peptidase
MGQPVTPLGPQDFARWRQAGLPALSPDGQAVLYTLTDFGPDGRRSNIVRLNTEGPETVTDDGVSFDPAWAPDGRGWAWFSGRGDAARLMVRDDSGTRVVAELSGTPRRPMWSPDGTRIAFELLPPAADPLAPRRVTRVRFNLNGVGFLGDRVWRVLVADVASGRVWQIGDDRFHHFSPAWRPDSGRLAVVTTRRRDWDIEWVWDVWTVTPAGEDWQCLTPSDGVSLYPAWSPDGSRIALLHNHANWTGSTMDYHLLEVAGDGSRAPQCLADDLDRGAAEVYEPPLIGGNGPQYLADGSILWLVNQGGITTLMRTTGSGRHEVVATDVSWPTLDARGERAAVLWYSADRPGKPALLNLHGGSVTVLEDPNSWLRDRILARPRTLRTDSPDGPVETVVWEAPGTGSARPLLLNFHGGPHGAFGPYFQFTQQVLASHGYVVAAINYRGSAGYGQAFADLVHANWGPKEGEDGMAVVAALAAEGVADPGRVGVFGPSYGGYMTLWMLTHYPGQVHAGVGLSCLSHLATSVYGIDHWESGQTDMGGPPWEKPQYYRDHSPITRVNQVTAPLLLLHGEEDLTCLLIEAEMMFVGLRWQHKPVELVRYPGESHSFHRAGRLPTLVDAHERMLDWFGHWLKPSRPEHPAG